MGAAPGNKGGSIGSAIATDLSRHRATMPCGNKGGGMPRAGGEPGTTSVGPGIQTDMPSEIFDENLNSLLLKKNLTTAATATSTTIIIIIISI